MSTTIESILDKIRLGRQRNPTPLNACQVCGGPGRKTRVEEVGSLFCSSLCNKAEYHYAELFQLGGNERVSLVMKRKGLMDLPLEIQGMILLMAYNYRIESKEDWQLLKAMREFHFDELPGEGAQLREMIDRHVVPQFVYVHTSVIYRLTMDELSKFKGLTEMMIPFSNLERDIMDSAEAGIVVMGPRGDWTEILVGMKSLKNLRVTSVIRGENRITIDLTKLTQIRELSVHRIDAPTLRKMVFIDELQLSYSNINDEMLKPLTQLKSLTIFHSPKQLTGATISTLTNLTDLKIVENEILRDADLETLTQLKSLSLSKTLIGPNVLIHMTRLETLMMPQLGRTMGDEILDKLHNITKLDINGNVLITDKSLKKMKNLRYLDIGGMRRCPDFSISLETYTNLTSLGIRSNYCVKDHHIKNLIGLRTLNMELTRLTDQSIENLTNLTRLNIRGNEQITHECIQKLWKHKLRELHVDSKQYYMRDFEKLDNQLVKVDIPSGFNM